MDLIVLLRAFIKRKWILILTPLLAGAVVFMLTANLKKQYTSKAQLATGYTIKDVTNDDFNIMIADVQFNNLIETMLSTQVTGLTSYELLYHDLSSKTPFRALNEENVSEDEKIEKYSNVQIISVLRTKIDSIRLLNPNIASEFYILKLLKKYEYDDESLAKLLHVERAGRTDYVNVFSKTENPKLSAFIVNNLSNNLLRFNRSLQSHRSSGSLDTLAQQVEEKRIALYEKQNELAQYKTQLGILDLDESGKSKIDLINTFEGTLADEKKTLRINQSELAGVYERLQTIAQPDRNSSSELLRVRQQINTLENDYQNKKDPAILKKLTELRQRRSDLALNTENEDKKSDRELRKTLLDKADDLKALISASGENIKATTAKISNLNSNVSSFAGKEAEILSLEQQVELAKTDYITFNEKYNTALDLNSSVRTSGISQILIGQPAIEPEGSKRIIFVGLAVVATFLSCSLIILMLEYFDFSIKTPQNFSKLTKIRILGSLPTIPAMQNAGSFFYEQETLGLPDSKAKLLYNRLNKLRYELESSGKKTFLLTSTKEQEGKTSTLKLLAKMYAGTRKNILIIDSNFSNNEITQKIKVTPKATKQQVLGGKNWDNPGSGLLVSNTKDIISETEHKNIDIIGCKEGYYLPSELFPDHDPLNKFKELGRKYDYIFIEGTSLNNYSDSKELSKYVDGVVLVVSMQSQLKFQDKESLSFVKGLNGNFMGAILNNVNINDL